MYKNISFGQAVFWQTVAVVVFFWIPFFVVFADTQLPAFYADTNGSTQTVTAGVQSAVTVFTERYDATGSFTPGSDSFSAPVSGFYIFNGSFACVNGTGYCSVHIVKNGTVVATSYNLQGTADSHNPNITYATYLDVNDAVRLYVTAAGTTIGGGATYNWFSGAMFAPTSTVSSNSTTTQVTTLSNPVTDLFQGLLLFCISFWGIIWFFRRNH